MVNSSGKLGITKRKIERICKGKHKMTPHERAMYRRIYGVEVK